MKARPQAYVAVLEGTKSAPAVLELFALATTEVELVEQLHDLANAFGNRLDGLKVNRVLVRRADTPKQGSNKEGPRSRLLLEGALAFAARRRVDDTRLMNGRDLAVLAGSGHTKASLDAAAASLSKADYAPAVAAADRKSVV